jgi:DTW domain-containing protein YfiP
VLYPHPSATPLEDWRGRVGPVALVVPDGTWAQATRIHARLGALAGAFPCVSLPGSGAAKRLRTARSPHQMATLEAVALALGILEGPEVQAALLRVYRIMTERTLWTNGRIATADVTGGIPAGIRKHDPLFTGR